MTAHLAACSGCLLPAAALVTCWDRGCLYSYCYACFWPPPAKAIAVQAKRGKR